MWQQTQLNKCDLKREFGVIIVSQFLRRDEIIVLIDRIFFTVIQISNYFVFCILCSAYLCKIIIIIVVLVQITADSVQISRTMVSTHTRTCTYTYTRTYLFCSRCVHECNGCLLIIFCVRTNSGDHYRFRISSERIWKIKGRRKIKIGRLYLNQWWYHTVLCCAAYT